jgi:hypothetical protein
MMAAGHYYGPRLSSGHPQAEYRGLNSDNILYFAFIACLTDSVTTRLHASPILLSLFTIEEFSGMICETLFSHNKFSCRFIYAILITMPTLSLFNPFTELLWPIVLRLFRDHNCCEKQMALLLIYLSNPTTSLTSFLRQTMIRDEGYIRDANNEMTKDSKERMIEEEKQFWKELGDEAI